MNKISNVVIFAFLLAAIGTASRLMLIAPNFTAVTGVTIFAGYAIANRWVAISVPVLAMLIADIVLAFTWGWYDQFYFSYAGMIAAVFFGRWYLRELGSAKLGRFNLPETFIGRLIASVLKLTGVVLLSSFTFFVLSNLGTFATGYYGYTWEGLVACYVAAIPFWQTSLVADFSSTFLVFGLFYLASFPLPSLKAEASWSRRG